MMIEGEPVLFMGRGEADWKERIKSASGALARPPAPFGARLRFFVGNWKRRGHHFDLDNLVKPALDALAIPDLAWIDATMELSPRPGLEISLETSLPEGLPPIRIWFESSVRGSFKHTDAHLALAGAPALPGGGSVQVVLQAHEERDPISDFGFEGFVKPTIDQLWPVLGGEPGKPHDHRIRRIVVCRSDARPSGVSLGLESWFALPAVPVTPKTGQEPFMLAGAAAPFRLSDFWGWGCSDLVNNAMRGVLAEFIVGSALGCLDGRTRVEWDACDLRTADGIRVEVKSSAYVQSWNQEGLSKISFSIKPAYGWDSVSNLSATERTRSGDVYVFCLLAHQDKSSINPLNLDQWRFYVLPASRLNESLATAGTLGLSTLENLGPEMVSYPELDEAVERAAERGGTDAELMRHFMRMSSDRELEVGQVSWRGQTPSLEWEKYKTWHEPPKRSEVRFVMKEALGDSRFFRVCSHCGERSNRGHMHDEKVCQGCAQTHFGVVY